MILAGNVKYIFSYSLRFGFQEKEEENSEFIKYKIVGVRQPSPVVSGCMERNGS